MTRILTIVTCAIVLSGCGGNSTGPTSNQATAVIQMSAAPQVITAAVCPPSHCGTLAGQLEVEGTIAIRETAGVAATASHLALTLRRRTDNAAIAATDATAAGGTRINANGTVNVPFAMHFDATAAESNMKVVVALDGSDANGHPITSTIEIDVRAS